MHWAPSRGDVQNDGFPAVGGSSEHYQVLMNVHRGGTMNLPVEEPMADVRDMYAAHMVLRREFRLLPDLIRTVQPGDARRSEVVGAHAALVCDILHLHHEGEDLLLWPLLLERAGQEAAAIVPTMEKQHHTIGQAHEEAMNLLPSWRATAQRADAEALADVIEQLTGSLVEHLALEEKEILPLTEKYLTASEWKRLGEHGLGKTPKKTLPLIFGMVMYEGDPAVIKEVLAGAPLPARLLMPAIGPRVYAGHAKRVHGTSTPPRIGAA